MISYTVQYTDIYVNAHIYEGWWMLCWQNEYGLADQVGEYGIGAARECVRRPPGCFMSSPGA